MSYTWGTQSLGSGTVVVPASPLVIGTAGQTAPVQEFLASQDASRRFGISVDQFDNAASPHNQVLDFGWNINQEVAGEPVLRLSMESNYLSGSRFMEFHHQYTSDDGGTSRRYYTVAIDRSTDNVDQGLYQDTLRLGNAAGTIEYWQLASTGRWTSNNTAATGSVMFQRTAAAGQNRSLLGADKDASGGTYVDLLSVRSDVGHGADTVYWDLSGNWPRWYINGTSLVFLQGGLARLTSNATRITVSHQWAEGSIITPTALSGDVNDYAPTSLQTCMIIRLSGGAANRNITGLAATNIGDGAIVTITNIGTTNNLVLVHASASSAAANRFSLPAAANVTLTPGMSQRLWYDLTSTVWRHAA